MVVPKSGTYFCIKNSFTENGVCMWEGALGAFSNFHPPPPLSVNFHLQHFLEVEDGIFLLLYSCLFLFLWKKSVSIVFTSDLYIDAIFIFGVRYVFPLQTLVFYFFCNFSSPHQVRSSSFLEYQDKFLLFPFSDNILLLSEDPYRDDCLTETP
jgi:hypothetical protein